jgi:hypothetical protein
MDNIDNHNISNDFEARYKTWHTWLSYIKSAIRIITSITIVFWACFISPSDAIILVSVLAAGYGLAEIVGILEEM